MRVFVLSANFLTASPNSPGYIAGAALAAGHSVEVFKMFFAQDLNDELTTKVQVNQFVANQESKL